MRRTLIGSAVMLLLGVAAQAQTIRGATSDSSTGAPIGGVVISQLDSRGVVLVRSLTDRSTFTVELVPGATRLQFRRIGFAPVETPVGRADHIEVRMRRLPQQLPVVRTVEDKRCDDRPDRAQALALWEQARTAFLAAAVARDTRAAFATILRFQYTTGSSGPGEQSVLRAEERRKGRMLGAALPPAALARDGYRVDTLGSHMYFAPDEVVLIDDTFVATHCFELSNRGGKDTTVGIRFEPDRNRKNIDIAGEVILRKDPLELLRIDFRFVGLEKGMPGKLGGFLAYNVMPIGVSMATHWHLRIPAEMRFVTMSVNSNGRQRFAGVAASSLVAESGALIERISWEGYEPWVRQLPSVVGRVRTDGGGPKTEAGLHVALGTTPYSTSTDSSGNYRIDNVLPGRYSIRVADSVLYPFGVPRGRTRRIEVDSSGVARIDDIEIRGRDDALDAACQPTASNVRLKGEPGSALLLARIIDSLANAKHHAFRVQRADGDSSTVDGSADLNQTFRVCNLALGETLRVSIPGPRGRVEQRVQIIAAINRVTLVIK
jgi:hypothetical protein